MRLRIRQDEPSTSKSTDVSPPSPKQKSSPNSPTSPVCRVAKRNARLLNGLDLNMGASSYTEQLLGMIPDFSVRNIHEACPALQPALNSGLEIDGTIDNMLLGELQFQLEGLLGGNLDYQRNIDGERTYLNTGDYPKADFSCRAMPTYELRSSGRKAKRKTEPEEQQPSCSYADTKEEEDDAGSDVVSSVDEGEYEEEPYCVLDIPHRFWTWAREYVGHVDAKFLRDFDENFFKKYQPENMSEFFVNEPFKNKVSPPHKAKSPTKQPHLNGVIKEDSAHRRQPRSSNGRFGSSGARAPSPTQEEPPKKARTSGASKLHTQESTDSALPPPVQTPEHTADLMKRLVAAYVEEKANVDGKKPPKRQKIQPTPKKLKTRRMSKSGRVRIPTAKMKSAMNGINGRQNGTSDSLQDILTDDEDEEEKMPVLSEEMLEILGTALAECVLPASIEMSKTVAESDSGVSAEHEEGGAEEGGLSNMENYELINLQLGNKSGMNLNDLDEVSLELLKAQQRLETLIKKTAPALQKAKKELEAEHAHWMTNRALNKVDDELFRLSNKLPSCGSQPPPELLKKCFQLWEKRKQRLRDHHLRDHVKLTKLMDNLLIRQAEMARTAPAASSQQTPKSNRSIARRQ